MDNFKTLIFIIMISFIFSFSDFTITINSNENECFHDYYSEQTLIVVECQSDDSTEYFDLKIKDPNGKEISRKEKQSHVKDSFTTFDGGNYNFCLTNSNSKQIKLKFTLKSGVSAKDYSALPQSHDLKPIEQDLLKLEDWTSDLRNLISFFNMNKKEYHSVQESIIMNISYFSIIIIIIMLIFGLIEGFISRHIIITHKIK